MKVFIVLVFVGLVAYTSANIAKDLEELAARLEKKGQGLFDKLRDVKKIVEGVVEIYEGIAGELEGGELGRLATDLKKAPLEFIKKLSEVQNKLKDLVEDVKRIAGELKGARGQPERDRLKVDLLKAEERLEKLEHLIQRKH